MIYVGIDVAKETHYAAVSDDSSKVLVKPFAFENTAEGFCLLLSKISEFPKEDGAVKKQHKSSRDILILEIPALVM